MAKSMDEALKRLAARAQALNEKSDSVNAVLERANQKLSAMNLGVTHWLTCEDPPDLLDVQQEDEGGHVEGLQLGYAKIDEQWQLAVRPVALSEFVDLEVLGEPIALLKASRLARIEACFRIEALIEALTVRVDRLLAGIATATAQISEKKS